MISYSLFIGEQLRVRYESVWALDIKAKKPMSQRTRVPKILLISLTLPSGICPHSAQFFGTNINRSFYFDHKP